jgi:hypothetical protein
MAGRLVLVHGINDNAGWHEKVRRVFDAHFDCHSVRYREYFFLGEFQYVFWPPALLLLPAFLAVGWHWSNENLAVALAVCCLIVLAVEYSWDGLTGHLAAPVLCLAAGLGLAFWVWPSSGQRWLILALSGLVVCLEARVYHAGDPDRYDPYWHGRSFFWPWLPLPLLASLAWEWAQYSPNEAWWCSLAVLAAWSLAEPHLRRGRALTKVNKQLAALCGGNRPHVIAHSMGTYLVGWVLDDNDDEIQIERLVVIGCVLPRDFLKRDRMNLLRRKIVGEVLNEQGLRDWVPWAASFGGFLGFGDAGLRGFDGPPVHVHHTDNPSDACDDCALPSLPARVHNVVLPKKDHVKVFLSEVHAFKFWLPYLWGMPPVEFTEFLRLCRAGAVALGGSKRPPDWPAFAKVERKFNRRVWNFFGRVPGGGKTMLELVTDALPGWKTQLRPKLTPRQLAAAPADLLPGVLAQLCRIVNGAAEQQEPTPGGAPLLPQPARNRRIERLNPTLAVSHAVSKALRKY